MRRMMMRGCRAAWMCHVPNRIRESDSLTRAPSASMDFASDWYQEDPTEGVPAGSAGYWLEQQTPTPPQIGPTSWIFFPRPLFFDSVALLGPHRGKEKETGGWVACLGRRRKFFWAPNGLHCSDVYSLHVPVRRVGGGGGGWG